jgi:photosystem II stability/assembly factor-like uncharacterized protein
MIRLKYNWFFLLLFLSIMACQFSEQGKEPFAEQEFDKEYPNDLFTFQRSYPYRKFDIKAYESGLKQAQQMQASRNSFSPGLEEDWTVVGPGNFGGRVNSVAVHPNNEDIIYLGFATGGVFKTINGGSSWEPIFDDQPFLAIGDIALDPIDPNTIYVGTGDPNISGYPAIGNGLYRSSDGGATWDYLGLQDQRIISKIIIDPINTNVIYAACMGLPFERNNDRGLYKSVDGGTGWQQVLFTSNQSGIIDMVMDPNDSDILYASSWDRIRNNEESMVAGPNGKIHKTTDGGLTWAVLSNGLPSGTVGRIGLDISKNNSNVLVSVFIDSGSDLLGVYKTEDAGANWSALPTSTSNGLNSNVMGGFGWYFGQIRLHPSNDNWIYMLGVQAWFTSSNGAVWSVTTGSGANAPHVDYHDLVFNFQNDIIVGNDGGAYKRESNGTGYNDIEDLPTTQVYRVAYDPHRPDNFYGGSQDNGTLAGTASDISNWTKLIGGDGFQLQFDPIDSTIVYVELQRGNIFRSTNGLSGFTNATTGIIPNDRRHWDMQYFISPHAANRLYTGTYRVYKTETDDFLSWSAISGDLTDGSIFGDAFHTITTLDESPQMEGLLYVGTTDANVWRSEDGGVSWDSIHTELPERYITSIKADPDNVDRVFVCVSGYRYNEYVPRVYRSDDRGNSWMSIASNLPDLAVNDIIILPGQNSQVLFVATDGGVYASTDAGNNWERLGTNMPMVTTYDLTINEAQNLLVAGTFGRSIYTYPIDSVLNNIPESFSIGGQVVNVNGVGVDSVLIDFGSVDYPATFVDSDGQYQLNDIPIGSLCTVQPSKNINIRNGISTFDMLLMQKHILQIDTLATPYQILAGDVNDDGQLSTFDVLINRRVLLELQDTFINTPSWNFVASDYNFQNPVDPFDENYSTGVTCADFSSGASGNFIGIKMGDVNASASPDMLGAESEDRAVLPLELQIENQVLEVGKTYTIPLKLGVPMTIQGAQFSLKFSNDILFYELSGGKGINLSTSNYSYRDATRTLLFSWSDHTRVNMKKNEAFIYLKIKSLRELSLSGAMQLEIDRFSAEAYGGEGQFYRPELVFVDNKSELEADLLVYPNPFSERSTLDYHSLVSGLARLVIYSADGSIIRKSQLQLREGDNPIELLRSTFPSKGLYIIKLSTENEIRTAKLIVQ